MKISWVCMLRVLILVVLIAIVKIPPNSKTQVKTGLIMSSPSEEQKSWHYTTGGGVSSITISSDGSYIAAGTSYYVHLFSRTSSTPLWSYPTGEYVRSVAISSDGNYIVAGGDDNKVHLFSRANNTPLWSYQTGSYVNSVSISSDGSYVVAGGHDENVYLFSRTSGTPLWSYDSGANVTRVAISSDGNYIAAANVDNLYFFSRESNTPLWSYDTYYSINSLAISSDGGYTVVGEWWLYLFSPADNTPLWISYETHGVDDVSISSDGSYMGIGGRDTSNNYSIFLFSRTSSTPLWSYGINDDVESISISSDGNYIVAGNGGKVYFFSRTDNTPLWIYDTRESYYGWARIDAVSVSSDGNYIVADDEGVRLFPRTITNTAPALTSGSVSPENATDGVTFTFEVTYTDADNDAPFYPVRVYIDESSHDMTKISGTYASGALYRYTWSTAPTDNGSHTYYFEAGDRWVTTRLPSDGSYSGPNIKLQSAVAITPSSFTIKPGENTTLTATLTSHDTPVEGKTITWSASAGSVAPENGITNSDGQVTVTYTAPDNETTVSITASFAGDALYAASSENSLGTIAVPSSTLTISPSNFSLLPGENKTLTATLTFDGNPLENKLVTWYVSGGRINPLDPLSETDSFGQISAIFEAPAFYFPDPLRISASFAGEYNKYKPSSDNSYCTLLFAILTFSSPDGTPIKNTAIYYGFSSDQITAYLGTTDNEGKITLENSDLGGQTIYFKTTDGKYAGSTSVGATGGEITTELAEVPELPIVWIVFLVAILVAAIGIVVFVKKRK